ncbi:MAG: hypothetical protein IT320_14460 [Anaerolineae bacterium]|nr:hypothetical protein [Anaerolineae bacterium]
MSLPLFDHQEETCTFDSIMGERGILPVFIGDIWAPGNERVLRWINRITRPLAHEGINSVLVTSNAAHTLKGFFASSPLPLTFPLLADNDLQVRRQCAVERKNAILLIDVQGYIRAHWFIAGRNLPRLKLVLNAIQSFNLPAE